MLAKNFNAAEESLEQMYDTYQPKSPYRDLDLARLEIQRGRYQNAMDALDRLEQAGNHAVFTLLYHGLTESEWMALTSTRRLYEHLVALRNAGFTFMAPSDIPGYLERGERRPVRPGPRPWLARTVDKVRYAFTGESREVHTEEIRPAKVAVVTFDDGLRTSFQLGTPIAQELGFPFGMHVITHLEELNAPMYAAWEEVRAAHESGAWEIHSHLMYANTDQPIGPDPEPKVFNLVNRVWVPERNRLETLREWSVRIRKDFENSRAMIETHLGLPPGTPMAVAYPYGEIGQEEGSNVAHLVNPIRTVLNEAARQYQAGFVVDRSGYTTAGDDVLMIRRYEPGWDEDPEQVVEAAIVNHPTFMARRLRAEIAILMDRPHLADRQIELLRRDGYPDRLLRELINFTQNRLPTAVAQDLGEADRAGTRRGRLRPSNLYLAGQYFENQSSEQILLRGGEVRAGLNLSAILGIEVGYRSGIIEQTVMSNYWFKVETTETSSSTETRTETRTDRVNPPPAPVAGQRPSDGTTTTTSSSTITSQNVTVREVQTNRIEKYEYEADVEEVRGSLTLRINDQATLVGTIGQKTLSLKSGFEQEASTHDELIGSLLMSWRPYRAIQVIASYDRDLIPSARRKIIYDSLAFNLRWKVKDGWDLAANTRYWSLEDKNAMSLLSGSSFWQVLERQGIWLGIESGIYTMDEDSDFYWSPYWDTRYAGVLSLRRAYELYSFQFHARIGRQREKGRPADVEQWMNLKAQADSDGTWSAGNPPGSDWDTYVGIGANYRQRIWRHLDLIGEFYVNFLRDYSEHNIIAGLQYNF